MEYNFFKNKKDFFILCLIDFFIIYFLYKENYSKEIKFFVDFFVIYTKSFLFILLAYIFGRYSEIDTKKKNLLIKKEFIRTFLITFIAFISVGYFKNKLVYLTFFSLNFSVLFIVKIFHAKYFSRRVRNLILCGDNDFSNKLIDTLNETYNPNDYKIYNYSEIEMNKNKIDYFIYQNKSKANNILKNIDKIKTQGKIEIINILTWSEKNLYRLPTIFMNSSACNQLIKKLKLIKFQLKIKRFFDIIASLILIIITLPIIILSFILLKIEDNGPMLYKQKRTGLNGKEFEIVKIRSMNINAEKDGPRWSQSNDQRVTRIGFFLRKFRIDELPQLFLVLKGKMSLIGPRPERPEFEKNLKEINYYSLRNKIKPGISGWAQVNYNYGASFKDTEIKLSYDLYYIKNYSIILDILILFKTLKIVFNSNWSDPIKK
tara:strand:- start:2337 stop:3629 length:1293 start_codon:yes stop_codon:yes gene_type:complete